MKKSIVLLILLAACKQTETTNETTTTMTVTESSATVATVAPTTTTVPPPAPATAAIETMGTNPAANVGSQGADLFKAKGCPVCHGASGAGNTAMGKKNNIRDFHSAAVQSQTDEQLVTTIRDGKGPVSASAHKSKALSAEQARSVVAWIRTLK